MKKYLLITAIFVALLSGFVAVNAQSAGTLSVDLKANNSENTITVANGSAVALSWSTHNAISCMASGPWTGTRSTGDSEITPSLSTGTYNYVLNCTDGSNVVSDSVTVIVQPATPVTPDVDLKANNTAGSVTISSGSNVALSWSTHNATACTASGDWTGSRSTGDSEIITAPAVGSHIYTLTCVGTSGATANDSVTVNVQSVQNNGVTVELKVNGVSAANVDVATSSQFTLSWTTTNATACTASGDWTGSKVVNGSEILTSPAATSTSQTFTLSCTGANNSSGSDTITITTFGDTNPTGPLVITNVRVTDVTSNSAILRWTTNRVASSRALYDTTSHPSISGQSAPNYSYASSTGTSDVDTKVIEHAVSITGLSANTTYFFRAVSQE